MQYDFPEARTFSSAAAYWFDDTGSGECRVPESWRLMYLAGDQWREVATMADAVAALGETPRRVFLTQGRLQLAAFAVAPQHFYLVRAIDEPDELRLLPHHKFVAARGPFTLEGERALMRAEAIEILVSKNSGGGATAAKLTAARELNIPVVLVARPQAQGAAEASRLDEVLDWIEAHRPAP